MADTNDRNQGSEHDLFDETAPRSIFAATWFRAVLVLIVLGVIGAVAVPYILDAMNAPKPSATAKLPMPVPPRPAAAPPPPPVAVTPPPAPTAPPGTAATTPAAPPAAMQAPSTPPPAVASTPAPAAMMDKPTDTKEALATATTPPEATKPEPKPKAEAKARPEPKATAESKTVQVAKATPAPAKSTAKTVKAGGQWFVQVGAFKDAGTAQKVAGKLRDDNYKVEESPRSGPVQTVASTTTAAPSSGSGDQYDVFIAGQSPADLNQRLAAKGLTAEASANGAVVKPSLPLRDAVALSKDLAVDGLKVQVRRAGSTLAPSRSSSGATASAGGDGLHRVSVGGFPDRATAMATLKELEAKGYKPFLTRR